MGFKVGSVPSKLMKACTNTGLRNPPAMVAFAREAPTCKCSLTGQHFRQPRSKSMISEGGERVTVEVETEHAPAQDARRQGDIIQLEYPEGETGPSLGLVINADCDLANGKTDGTIAYLPIFNFREYLTLFWVPSHLRSTAITAENEIVKMTNAGSNGVGDLVVMFERLAQDEVQKRLCGLPGVKTGNHANIKAGVCKLSICYDESLTPYTRFQRLCRQHKDPQKHAQSLIESAKKEMGDGHFFLSDLYGRSELGFVIRMRRIYSLPEDEVFTSVAAQCARSTGSRVTGVRFARLRPLYRFKAVQLFANQFSRVGLPDEITALSALVVDDIVSDIVGSQ